MATAFRFVYRNVCCGICCGLERCCRRRRQQQQRQQQRRQRYTDVTVTSSSPVNGRFQNRSRLNRTAAAASAFFRRKKTVIDNNDDNDDDVETGCDVIVSPAKHQPPPQQRRRIGARMRDLANASFENVDTVRVPASVCLLLMTGYIALGALMFTLWGEKDWDFLIGCYFCFITLSTIGFGDYVPGGTDVTAWASQEKLVCCAFYMLFGLALIAMCFELIQEEALRNLRAVGQKLGLVDALPEEISTAAAAAAAAPAVIAALAVDDDK